jgi:hypothetical protein
VRRQRLHFTADVFAQNGRNVKERIKNAESKKRESGNDQAAFLNGGRPGF